MDAQVSVSVLTALEHALKGKGNNYPSDVTRSAPVQR